MFFDQITRRRWRDTADSATSVSHSISLKAARDFVEQQEFRPGGEARGQLKPFAVKECQRIAFTLALSP